MQAKAEFADEEDVRALAKVKDKIAWRRSGSEKEHCDWGRDKGVDEGGRGDGQRYSRDRERSKD